MKLNKTKLALCLLAASTASVSFMSHAAGSFSIPSTQEVNFDIVAPGSTSTLVLTKASSLPDANVKVAASTIVATAENTINGGTAQSGIRFTPNNGVQEVNTGDNSLVTLHGTGLNTNKLELTFITPADAAQWVELSGDKYFVTDNAVASQKIDIGLSSEQTIAADIYNLSMDGVVYNP